MPLSSTHALQIAKSSDFFIAHLSMKHVFQVHRCSILRLLFQIIYFEFNKVVSNDFKLTSTIGFIYLNMYYFS